MLAALLSVHCGAPPDGAVGRGCQNWGAPPEEGPATPATRLVNAYYLQEEAARDVRAGLTTSPHLEEVLDKAQRLGVGVVRTLAFDGDPAHEGSSAIQLGPGRYDETSFRGLDRVLARAAARGVKLVLPMGNYWDPYGGARQFVAWAGLPQPKEGDPRFFTDPGVRALYRAWLTTLLTRINTVDGRRYGDHPAVLAWELLNEPRGTGLSPDGHEMRAWVDEMGAWVKSLAPGTRLSTGEEGGETSLFAHPAYDEVYWRRAAPYVFAGGNSFALDLASPFVDLASVHLYPEFWGGHEDREAMALRWLAEKAAVAHALHKPLLVGEFGLANSGHYPLELRRDAYRRFFSCADRSGAALIGPWMLSYDARPDAADDFTFYFRDGTQPADLQNRYADLLRAPTP